MLELSKKDLNSSIVATMENSLLSVDGHYTCNCIIIPFTMKHFAVVSNGKAIA